VIDIKFCCLCGSGVTFRIPDGDHLPRHICNGCGEIHYQNPKVVAGCIPHWGDQILLCKRAIQPRVGFWTVPAGFMENNETIEQAAMRETDEEARAKVTIDGLYGVFNIPHISQIYVLFRGALVDGNFSPGPESLETALYDEADIPWDEIAFPVVTKSLRRFFADRVRGVYEPFIEQVEPFKR